MAIIDIVIVAYEHIWCLYGEVPYVGGGLRDVQQAEGRLSGPSIGEGFGGSSIEVGRPCPRTCHLVAKVYGRRWLVTECIKQLSHENGGDSYGDLSYLRNRGFKG